MQRLIQQFLHENSLKFFPFLKNSFKKFSYILFSNSFRDFKDFKDVDCILYFPRLSQALLDTEITPFPYGGGWLCGSNGIRLTAVKGGLQPRPFEILVPTDSRITSDPLEIHQDFFLWIPLENVPWIPSKINSWILKLLLWFR